MAVRKPVNARNQRVRRNLARKLLLVVIEVERQLVGTGRDHHMRILKGVALAGHRIVVGHGEILLVEIVLLHKLRHARLQRILRRFRVCRRNARHQGQQHRRQQEQRSAAPFSDVQSHRLQKQMEKL